MAEFDSAQALIDAARKTHAAGTRRSTPTAPSPSKGWPKKSDSITMKFRSSSLIGGIVGGVTGYLMQYWMSAVDYPPQHRRQALSFLAVIHRHHF